MVDLGSDDDDDLDDLRRYHCTSRRLANFAARTWGFQFRPAMDHQRLYSVVSVLVLAGGKLGESSALEKHFV